MPEPMVSVYVMSESVGKNDSAPFDLFNYSRRKFSQMSEIPAYDFDIMDGLS